MENVIGLPQQKRDLSSYYLAFVLDEESRTRLLKNYPAAYSNVVCHHVTICFHGVSEAMVEEWQNKKQLCQVMRHYCKDDVECFSVMLENTMIVPDIRRLHLTHSLAEGKKAVQSNELLVSVPTEEADDAKGIILFGSTQLVHK